ncbi:hypothetical protein BCR41DRAFT_370916 [Lobosporangium transversale]|uniref:Uncharacterized protein n=1 Tax=Lobosporangium transversale TaxID=64571 RepID=A0A1Y2GMH6_9FUNG|nr:hypothetical protein BCR41DRAFT_370916 [Lobosporangium transversale]ORZ15568.1 hypothetical protein BCR41DRAFT_370916 [Lobosporangium transversale]|eukprot:XP_021881316.1 hypothetical protein BCR41DRAFT_370916 [Lobosporangium transversale]
MGRSVLVLHAFYKQETTVYCILRKGVLLNLHADLKLVVIRDVKESFDCMLKSLALAAIRICMLYFHIESGCTIRILFRTEIGSPVQRNAFVKNDPLLLLQQEDASFGAFIRHFDLYDQESREVDLVALFGQTLSNIKSLLNKVLVTEPEKVTSRKILGRLEHWSMPEVTAKRATIASPKVRIVQVEIAYNKYPNKPPSKFYSIIPDTLLYFQSTNISIFSIVTTTTCISTMRACQSPHNISDGDFETQPHQHPSNKNLHRWQLLRLHQ